MALKIIQLIIRRLVRRPGAKSTERIGPLDLLPKRCACPRRASRSVQVQRNLRVRATDPRMRGALAIAAVSSVLRSRTWKRSDEAWRGWRVVYASNSLGAYFRVLFCRGLTDPTQMSCLQKKFRTEGALAMHARDNTRNAKRPSAGSPSRAWLDCLECPLRGSASACLGCRQATSWGPESARRLHRQGGVVSVKNCEVTGGLTRVPSDKCCREIPSSTTRAWDRH
jgi:hypothetical protein